MGETFFRESFPHTPFKELSKRERFWFTQVVRPLFSCSQSVLRIFVTFFSKKVTPKNFLTFKFWFTQFARPLFDFSQFVLEIFVTFFSKKVTPKNFLTFRFWFTLFVRPLCCADLIKTEKHTTQTIICRGEYHPPEYNKKDFRLSENLPTFCILHFAFCI